MLFNTEANIFQSILLHIVHFQQPKNEGFSARRKFKVNFIFLIGNESVDIFNSECCFGLTFVLLLTHGKIKLSGTRAVIGGCIFFQINELYIFHYTIIKLIRAL